MPGAFPSLVLIGILAAVTTILSSAARASVGKSKISQNETALREKFLTRVDLSQTEKFVQQNDSKEMSLQNLDLSLTYKLNPSWELNSLLGYSNNSKECEDPNNGLADLKVGGLYKGLSHYYGAYQNLNGALYLPTSKYSQDYENQKLALSLGYQISFSGFLLKSLDFLAGVSLKKYFHEYETQKNGEPVKSWSHSEKAMLSYNLQNWKISTMVENSHLYNQLNRRTDYFSHSEELAVQFTKAVDMGIGHSNRGNWLKEDRESSNFQVFNQNDSLVYLRLGVQI